MPEPVRKWAVRIRDATAPENRGWTELGIVEAPNHGEAFLTAIKTFNVPMDQQNRVFVLNVN
jgi:hypothetical protein